MNSKRYRLPKSERLNSNREIRELFSKGSSFFVYPYKIKYLSAKESEPPSILISISKKFFKKAISRNNLKRKIKEAYRLTKGDYLSGLPVQSIAFIYVGKEENAAFDFLKTRMKKALEGISKAQP